MKIQLMFDYDDAESRFGLAKFISGLIMSDRTFTPYRPMESDDTFWKVDAGNDWSLTFSDETPNIIEMRYRYQCDTVKAEEALVGWLVYRLNGELV